MEGGWDGTDGQCTASGLGVGWGLDEGLDEGLDGGWIRDWRWVGWGLAWWVSGSWIKVGWRLNDGWHGKLDGGWIGGLDGRLNGDRLGVGKGGFMEVG